MNESYSIEAIDKTILSQEKFFWLSEIIRIENYFYQEINQRKTLIVLRAPSSAVLIISFTSIVRAPAGIASTSLTLIFSLTTGIVKKLLNILRNKKWKHDQILLLAKSKLNSIERLISQALIDMDISHEEFVTILKEKDKHENIKVTLRSENVEYKIMRLSSINSKSWKNKK